MKLLNKSLIYISISVFVIIGCWSVYFYFNMLQEIKESVDEGLENYKRQIIYNVERDSTILEKTNFDEGFFAIREISQEKALSYIDTYKDTMLLMQDSDDEAPELEPVRYLQTSFEFNGKYYELRLINSMVEEEDLITELLIEALVLYILLMALIIVINNIVLKRLWQPFYSFLTQLGNYRIGTKDAYPQVKTDTQEFVDLQQAVHILLQQNNASYEKQTQFIGNAAHELQTPLAIATNKLELLIEKGELNEQQTNSVAEVLSLIERLVRLNRSLLLLSKIENNQFLENEELTFNHLTRRCIEEMDDMINFKELNLSLEETGTFTQIMDPSLGYIVVGNLLRNALFHNKEHGKVTIHIASNTFRIANSGLKAPLNQEKLFTRFHKNESSTNGSGLGLAIVKAICELYQLQASYTYEQEEHVFTIKKKA